MGAVARTTPGGGAEIWDRLHTEASAIWDEDRAMCQRIGEAGLPLIPAGANVLTHCNAGALATGGIGTALAPIYLAHDAGRRVHVFADETRPVLQGARLTAWELTAAHVPCTLIADGVAASLMRAGRITLVLVGADRIARNAAPPRVCRADHAGLVVREQKWAAVGGRYADGKSRLARHHGVPFYCCAPSSTIDAGVADGDAIPIEERAAEEVTTLAGRAIAPAGVAAYNPAFDVTPAGLVSGFVTDCGILQPPFER
jgi:methylthioribose-1-phosphate isomerase